MPRKQIVAIGASAGGIEVLQTILAALPWDFPGSVFVVLHTSEDSRGLLPQILNRSSRLPVMYAAHNAPILPFTCVCRSRRNACPRAGRGNGAKNGDGIGLSNSLTAGVLRRTIAARGGAVAEIQRPKSSEM